MQIKKKIWPEYYEKIISGTKKYELRLNDFEANPADTLVLEEWDPALKQYTGRSIEKTITAVDRINLEQFWSAEDILEKGIQILSFE